MDRISRETIFMSVAFLFSNRATCLRGSSEGIKGGSCLVRDDRIISVGYAGSPPGRPHCTEIGCDISPVTGGCIRTLHSETNCILAAAKAGISTEGSRLYTTISPCLSCAKAIISAGIVKVVYLNKYRDSSGLQYLSDSQILTHAFTSLVADDFRLVRYLDVSIQTFRERG